MLKASTTILKGTVARDYLSCCVPFPSFLQKESHQTGFRDRGHGEQTFLKASTIILKGTVARDLLVFLSHLIFSKSPIKPDIEIKARENKLFSGLEQQFFKGQ
jgi:hypothetical protein